MLRRTPANRFCLSSWPPRSSALRVRLSGTHTKDEVNKACDGLANGIKVAGPEGKGYGCYNEDNGVLVACNDQGECMGFIPREQIPPESRIDDFLILKGPTKDGTGTRQPVDPFSLSEGETLTE